MCFYWLSFLWTKAKPNKKCFRKWYIVFQTKKIFSLDFLAIVGKWQVLMKTIHSSIPTVTLFRDPRWGELAISRLLDGLVYLVGSTLSFSGKNFSRTILLSLKHLYERNDFLWAALCPTMNCYFNQKVSKTSFYL